MAAQAPPTTTPAPDDLSIHVNNRIVTDWPHARFTCGIERFPRAFEVEITEALDKDYKAIALFEPGMPITVHLGKDKVMTGYIDAVNLSISGHEHSVVLSGRSMCEDLVDCSADLKSMTLGSVHSGVSVSAAQIATLLATPYGVKVKAGENSNSRAANIPIMVVNMGDTPYSIIERVARYCGYLIYDDEEGTLVLAEPATEPKASIVLKQGVNIKQAHVEFNLSERFSSYEYYSHAYISTIDRTGSIHTPQYGPDNDQSHGKAEDKIFDAYKTPYGAPRVRKLIHVADMPLTGVVTAQTRANWEYNRRLGRSQKIQIQVVGWRDDKGKLFRPNQEIQFDVPSLRLSNKTWLIADLTFEKGLDGTTTTMTLMDKLAFKIEPYDLWPNAADRLQSIPDAQPGTAAGGTSPATGPAGLQSGSNRP